MQINDSDVDHNYTFRKEEKHNFHCDVMLMDDKMG